MPDHGTGRGCLCNTLLARDIRLGHHHYRALFVEVRELPCWLTAGCSLLTSPRRAGYVRSQIREAGDRLRGGLSAKPVIDRPRAGSRPLDCPGQRHQ